MAVRPTNQWTITLVLFAFVFAARCQVHAQDPVVSTTAAASDASKKAVADGVAAPPGEQPKIDSALPGSAAPLVPSPRRMFDDRAGAPRLGPASVQELERKGYNLVSERFFGIPGYDKVAFVGTGTLIYDSTRIPASQNLILNTIPVAGQDFFDSGWRPHVFGTASIISYDLQADTSLGKLRAHYANDFIDPIRPQEFGYRLRHAYGQLGGLTAGQTFSLFTDVDSQGERVASADPPSAIFLFQNQLSYQFDILQSEDHILVGAFGIGDPSAEVTFNQKFSNYLSYARFPDLMALGRASAAEIGYVQLSGLLRSLAVESPDSKFDDQVFGWSLQLSGGLLPVYGTPRQPDCRLRYSVAYGAGFARFHTDLARSGNDAVLDADLGLHAVPLFTCRVEYTHFWTEALRSNVALAYTELDTLKSQDPFTFHRGQFASLNTVYNVMPKVTVGLGYQYGRKQSFNGNDGDVHRLAFTVAVATK